MIELCQISLRCIKKGFIYTYYLTIVLVNLVQVYLSYWNWWKKLLRHLVPLLLTTVLFISIVHGFVPNHMVINMPSVHGWTLRFDQELLVDVVFLDFAEIYDKKFPVLTTFYKTVMWLCWKARPSSYSVFSVEWCSHGSFLGPFFSIFTRHWICSWSEKQNLYNIWLYCNPGSGFQQKDLTAFHLGFSKYLNDLP